MGLSHQEEKSGQGHFGYKANDPSKPALAVLFRDMTWLLILSVLKIRLA